MAASRIWDTFRRFAVSLGNFQGVPIRLHAAFFLLLPLGLLLSSGKVAWSSILCAMVFMLVLIHECAHLCAARLLGSYYDEMVLWPLGGLVHAEIPLRPITGFMVAAAGPAAHLVIAILFLPWSVGDRAFAIWPLPTGDYPLLFLTVNRLLLVANLVPAFLTDGGRLWQGLLWHFFGFRRATLATAASSCLLSIGAIGYGVSTGSWPVAVLGSVLLLSAHCWRRGYRVAEVIDGQWVETPPLFGGYHGRRIFVSLRDWWGKRRQDRDHLQRVKDAQALDALLTKINQVGLVGLTPRERRFLQKQSDRLQRERGVSLR